MLLAIGIHVGIAGIAFVLGWAAKKLHFDATTAINALGTADKVIDDVTPPTKPQ